MNIYLLPLTLKKVANSQSSSSSGIGFTGLLTILFIGLKLTGYISWSWWLVLLPAYGVLALILLILLLFFIYRRFKTRRNKSR